MRAQPVHEGGGQRSESPMMISVKKIPMDSTCAEFWKVVFIPDPAPRSAAGRLFMTPVRLEAPNVDMPGPGDEQQHGGSR